MAVLIKRAVLGNAKLHEQTTAMKLDRFGAYKHLSGHLLRRKPLGHQRLYLRLARGEIWF